MLGPQERVKSSKIDPDQGMMRTVLVLCQGKGERDPIPPHCGMRISVSPITGGMTGCCFCFSLLPIAIDLLLELEGDCFRYISVERQSLGIYQ